VGITADETARTQNTRPGAAERFAGAGGLVFVSTLVVQNVIRSSGPSFGAAPGKVVAYFLHHRAGALIPLGLFPLGLVALVMFVAGVWTSTHQDDASRWWANVGALGAAAIVSLFALVNITEIALAAKAHQLATSPAVVQALWAVHAGAFGLDLAAIAVTLVGLSRAAASSHLIPSWIEIAALPAALCLLIAATFTVALATGAAWITVGLVGFLVWILFVATASIRLLRTPQ
jgi:hypothetical protein